MKVKIALSSLRIASFYALLSMLWIILSDRILGWIAKDYYQLELFQTIKGLFFVAATSLLLYFFSRKQMSTLFLVQSASEREALASLKEKELLLREIHHRVKNNLQIIVSLMSLNAEQDGLEDLKSKIRSMALVHELLYSSEGLSTLRADEFAGRLATVLLESYGEYGVTISGQGELFYIKVEKAVPIGIFVSEACANAVKHARQSPNEPLSIRISMRLEDAKVTVEVRDDGKGLGAADRSSLGLGTTLMAAVAEQAGGTLQRRDEGGAVVWFCYPAD